MNAFMTKIDLVFKSGQMSDLKMFIKTRHLEQKILLFNEMKEDKIQQFYLKKKGFSPSNTLLYLIIGLFFIKMILFYTAGIQA